MRPAVRLSALMGLETFWVWTHDSVALGEDGPTHQPVEHHAALRAIPNLLVRAPGGRERDGVAWRLALERRRPGRVALTRQKVPTFDRSESPRPRLRAARRLHALAEREGEPDVILIATGWEVALALEAARRLDANARVVSAPLLELFAEQGDEYRDRCCRRCAPALRRGRDLARLERWVGDRATASIERWRPAPGRRSSPARLQSRRSPLGGGAAGARP